MTLSPSPQDFDSERVGDATPRDHQQQQVRRATIADAVCAILDVEALVQQGSMDDSDEAKDEHIALYTLAAVARVWLAFEPDPESFVEAVGKVDGLGVDDLEMRLQVVLSELRKAVGQTDPPRQPEPSERPRSRRQSLVDAGAMAIALETVKHAGQTAIEVVKVWLSLSG